MEPSHSFENDCSEIHVSWGRLNRLAQVLARRTRLERRQIRECYKSMYGDDLVERLQKNRTRSKQIEEDKVCAALWLWMLEPHERDAVVAREALQQPAETDNMALLEILTGRKSSHIVLVDQAYQARFKRLLNQDIIAIEPPHPFQRILVALAASHKAHHVDASQHIAKCDARRLYETGEGRRGGIEESVVLEIFSKRSIPQLCLTFSSYKHIYGHDYTKSLAKENFPQFEVALKAVVKCMCSPAEYYAKVLHASIKGGTVPDKDALGRVMVSRCETDMGEIQRVFKRKYGLELRDAICKNLPQGVYRDFLVALAATTQHAISF